MNNKKAPFLVFPLIFFFFMTMIGLAMREHWIEMALTPIPKEYQSIEIGTRIHFDDPRIPSGQAMFIHFSNPSCGCAQFIKKHFIELVKDFSSQVQFIVVVEAENQQLITQEIQDLTDKLQLAATNVIFLQDVNGNLAKKVGVYSTPQAVILDSEQKLFFRGNYNASRYSTNTKTQYAYLALNGLLEKKSPEKLKAGYAIGCVLPTNLKENERNY
ncbi:MAG: hypothetical protein IPO06_00050 [Leptospiraceae bacterium]|nr:hypothetical protein [Leptospiraceae bacterium]MBK7057710.1 hypothetical protein [Leptospiraceae bacterium]MBK9497773.1 hypothetical protein [Leptospiraceae bacterium]